ncbi:LysR family transcriptional regulator [Paenibacillus alginolyticus]|uniref:LysR family transcriptional regulator n=1 Tax=Paenibacillus alginolyticus TaxID=59839 RepID=UPI000423F422|nr:LysR family transcriptional regulator [Paenibacillus alginolyticus]MCY9669979.1 LysR family transcriptional regulator [Paenibacillus alginolyticus]
MNEQDWSLLDSIYEEQNITKAAERLFISQPALTYRLQQIEQEFGIKVFNRTGKKITFTLEGEHLIHYAKKMLLELRRTKDYLANLHAHEVRGTLRIGASSNFSLYKLPAILKHFVELYPNVQIHLNTGLSSDIFRLLQNDEVQIAFIRGDYQWIEEKYLINEERICVISKHPIELEELPKLPRIHYQIGAVKSKIKFKTDPFLSKSIDTWWQEQFRSPPQMTMQVDSVETCKELVKHGLGYAIIPRICLTKEDDLHTIDLTRNDGQFLLRKTWMIYRESAMELASLNQFVNDVKSCFPQT